MLSRDEISGAVARYEEARPKFELLVEDLLLTLQTALKDISAKCVLSARAKKADSFRGKLTRNARDYGATDIAGDPVAWRRFGDLAAARLMVYDEPGRKAVEAAVSAAFDVPGDAKETAFQGVRGYRATHFRVALKNARTELVSIDGFRTNRLSAEWEMPCEIQVCLLTDHVWNELEHDIKYKQPDGKPDEAQVELLVSLRGELDVVGASIARLIERTARRRTENEGVIEGASDLRRYFEDRDRRTLDGDFLPLHSLLCAEVAKLTWKWLDRQREVSALKIDEAERVCREHDPDGAYGCVGAYAVHLVSVVTTARLAERVDVELGATPPPLWKFMLRVARALEIA